MNNVNTIGDGISQTPTTSQPLRDKDSKETTTEIDFSKWFGEHGSESISSEERAREDRFIANLTEPTFCTVTSNPTSPFEGQTCMELSIGENLGDIPDESDPPFSSFPYSYQGASNLGHQEPPLEQEVGCSQIEPAPWTTGNKEWAFVEEILNDDYLEISNLLDESDFSPCPYSMGSYLDDQEPLLSTEGKNTANRTPKKPGKPRKALNSLLFLLMNGNPDTPLPENENFSKGTTIYSYLHLWQKDGSLKSVLTVLEEKAQEPLKSYYRSLLKNFQEASNCQTSLRSLDKLKLKFDEPVEELPFEGVNDEQWFLIEPLLGKNEEPEDWSISDQEWALVESLLSTKVEKIESPLRRRTLNSVLFILMNGSNSNIPLPKDPNFSSRKMLYKYFNLWRQGGVFERVLTLLEKEAQEPLKSRYRSLVKNFQEASNCQDDRSSLDSLRLKFDEPVEELPFEGVNDEQWLFIKPLLSKADHRPALNLIFSLLITGASSFASSNLTERNEAAEYLALWKKDGTLENVLIQLIEGAQERVQSDYRKMLRHLQNLTAQPIPQLQPQPTRNEECDLMTDDESDLDHQGSPPGQVVKRREDDAELWSINDREWYLVEHLFKKKVKTKADPRKPLNSLLFILINGNSAPLPKDPDFSTERTANEYFLYWQTNRVLEEVLPILKKKAQKPLKSYYQKLLEKIQEISNPKTEPLSIRKFKKKFAQAGSGFQKVTDRQWKLIDPLLNKKIIECAWHHRRDLNSILSVIMKGVPSTEIPINSNFSGKTSFYKCFAAWKKDGTLKNVLTRLTEDPQGRLQSDYRKVLDRLQEGANLHDMWKLTQGLSNS